MKKQFPILIDGALIALGSTAILDNVVFHWGLKWHGVSPYPWSETVEIILFIAGWIMLGLGIWRVVVRSNAS